MNQLVQHYFSSLERNRNFLSHQLLRWYDLNKRDLPWRNTQDPYQIWISEIILQQTRVAQGLEYYLRFVQRFPDVQALAIADEEEVLKYWQGLGYYSRARNLHSTAQTIIREHGGVFPEDYPEILRLKGIGEYTAAAISSFAWNKPYPVVDGNVFRFLSRLFSIDEPIDTGKAKKIFQEIAQELLDESNPGLYNQAIMEFGALQCVPVAPDCKSCPFNTDCVAFLTSKVASYPVKSIKTKVQTRYLYYFHIRYGQYSYLYKRRQEGIWKNLYEFPMIESETALSFEELCSKKEFQDLFADKKEIDFRLVIENKKHVLSHRLLFANFYEVFIQEETPSLMGFQKVLENGVHEYPTHRLMQFYLEKTGAGE